MVTANQTMIVNGLSCIVNLPNAPKGGGTHRLPPGHPINTYKVDEFPGCPTDWMNGSSKASSYFFPIEVGKHMWLDFNMNINHTHHIAIVLSIQGINPITGLPSKILRLEQYHDKCPKHDIDFKQDRFCEKCDDKWPAQNYMTTTSCPRGLFWIDGFRSGKNVRGFLITEEVTKGIAAQMIGEDRVWAIGIAFYLSKKEKPASSSPLRAMSSMGISGMGMSSMSADMSFADSVSPDYQVGKQQWLSQDGAPRNSISGETKTCGMDSVPKMRSRQAMNVEVAKVEIAAGAEIAQELSYPDPEALDFYQDEPAGIIYGNYCLMDNFEKIMGIGVKDLTAGGKGFMKDLNIGNNIQ